MASGADSSRGPTLFWMLAASHLLVLLLALGVLAWPFLQLDSQLATLGEDQLRRQTRQAADRLPAELIEPGRGRKWQRLSTDELQSVAPELVGAVAGPDTLARVLDASGTELASSSELASRLPPPASELRRWARGRRVLRPRSSTTALEGENWWVTVYPLETEERLAGALQVAVRWDALSRQVGRLRTCLLAGGLAALLLGLGGSFGLARTLARPLERLTGAAQTLSGGNLTARSGHSGGPREARELARAFDQMAEQLEAAMAAQRRFLADASHELKTPLTAIGGMAELLRLGSDAGEPEARDRALAIIEREVERMARLVADLQLLARAEHPLENRAEPVDVGLLLEEAADLARALPPPHPISVTVTGGPLRTSGESDPLARMFRNLLENAVRYTPEGTPIEVNLRGAGSWIEVEVKDAGPGIPEADLAHLFERFYRCDPSRSRHSGGSGLGLAIARAIARKHGGELTASSQLGKGSTFTIRLPRPDFEIRGGLGPGAAKGSASRVSVGPGT